MTLNNCDIARLCRELALLLHAGIGLADGTSLLAQEEPKPLRDHLSKIAETLDQGFPLSEALRRSSIFPEHVWRMVRTGEETGRQEAALIALGEFYEDQHQLSLRLKNAISYPALVLLLMMVVLAVLLIKVMPIFDRVYASLGSRLTGIAAGLLYFGQGLDAILPVLFILLSLVLALGLVFHFCPSLQKKAVHSLQIRFGDRGIAKKFNNAHFARALAMGLSSGMTMDSCVELAQNLLQHSPDAAQRCSACANAMKEGLSVREAIESVQLLPPTQCRMLQLGIHSGNADSVMENIAQNLLEDAQNALDTTISRIEPAMVLICSLLVGVILLAVMLPLLDILSVLG